MATSVADGAVEFARGILNEILNSKESDDLANMLREAELMLDELQDREFTQAAEDAEMELDKALEGKCSMQCKLHCTVSLKVI